MPLVDISFPELDLTKTTTSYQSKMQNTIKKLKRILASNQNMVIQYMLGKINNN